MALHSDGVTIGNSHLFISEGTSTARDCIEIYLFEEHVNSNVNVGSAWTWRLLYEYLTYYGLQQARKEANLHKDTKIQYDPTIYKELFHRNG